MARIDTIKEQISFLKFWLGIAVATLLTLAGWLALNYGQASWLIVGGALACVLVCVISIYYISRSILRKISSLEEL